MALFCMSECMRIRRTEYFVNSYLLHDDGMFPNNSALPVIHYKSIFRLPTFFAARALRKHFALHGWTNSWKNTVHDFHHYHSTTHEVLGVYEGGAELLVGGDRGTTLWLEEGDVLVIPAGVAHKKTDPKAKILCVGAYPEGREYDMRVGAKTERPDTDHNIQLVPLPKKDPVFGANGELMFHWKGYRQSA